MSTCQILKRPSSTGLSYSPSNIRNTKHAQIQAHTHFLSLSLSHTLLHTHTHSQSLYDSYISKHTLSQTHYLTLSLSLHTHTHTHTLTRPIPQFYQLILRPESFFSGLCERRLVRIEIMSSMSCLRQTTHTCSN